MGDERSILPIGLWVLEEREQVLAVSLGLDVFGQFCICKRGEGSEQIDMGSECIACTWFDVVRPAPEAVCAGSSQPSCSFRAAHTCVEAVGPERGSIVVHEDDECLLIDAPGLELTKQPSDVFVDVVDHPVEVLQVIREFFLIETCRVFWSCVVRGVGSIGRNPA